MQPLIDLNRGKTKKIATIFEVTDFIGDGHFAQVYKAYNLMTKTDLAIKIYLGYDEHTSEIAKNEIGLLQELEDLNTDYFPVPKGGLRKQKIENRNHPLIALELCEYRSEDDEAAGHIIALNDLLILGGNQITQTGKVNNIWNRDVLFSFMRYLCDAVNMLHKKEIIHRDIKPSNILIKKPMGENTIKPFFIDFNTSKPFGSEESTGGTDSYLPPEVRSRNRTNPDKADDLWALAKIIGELVYGKNVEISANAKPHQLIEYKLPSKLVEVIQVGLEPNPEKRYPDAASFMAAINEATSGKIIEIEDDEEDYHVEGDELVWIRENKNNILRDLINIFCGDNQLPVLKETQDKVSSIYSSLYQDSTKSFELKEEIIRLGVGAVPALIEKSYKLIPNTLEFDVILEALTILANSDEKLAKKAIDLYCVSSDYSVRKICLDLSDNLQYFPTNLIDSIVDNDSLYLPDERVNIANICIKWSTDKNAMMPLNMYMCKEYILDKNRYGELRDKIALRVRELKFEEKAGLIIGDTKQRVWEELNEYEKLGKNIKKVIDNGLRELFADAFSSLGEEAFKYVKNNKVPIMCHENRLPIASAFIGKLSMMYPPARGWLFVNLEKRPGKELYFAAQRIKHNLSENEKAILKEASKNLNLQPFDGSNLDQIFNEYLINGRRKELNYLCNEGKGETIKLIEDQVININDPSKIKNLLHLVEAFKDRYRDKSIPLLLDLWNKIPLKEYRFSAFLLTKYKIPSEFKKQIIEVLEDDIGSPDKKDVATEMIERLL